MRRRCPQCVAGAQDPSMTTLLTYLLAAVAGAVIAGMLLSRRSRDVRHRELADLAAQRFARMFAALSDTNEAIMRVLAGRSLSTGVRGCRARRQALGREHLCAERTLGGRADCRGGRSGRGETPQYALVD